MGVAHTKKKPAYTKPAYSISVAVDKLEASSISAYVHTQSDYQNWLNWDPSLCYMETTSQDCHRLQGCEWKKIAGKGGCVKKSKTAEETVWMLFGGHPVKLNKHTF